MFTPRIIGCLPLSTLIPTVKGRSPFFEIKVGDRIHNTEGALAKVVQVHQTPRGDQVMNRVVVASGGELKLAAGGMVWAVDADTDPHWVSVQDLTTDHYVGIPLPKPNYRRSIQSDATIIDFAQQVMTDDPNNIDDLFEWDPESVVKLVRYLAQRQRVVGSKCANGLYYATLHSGFWALTIDGKFLDDSTYTRNIIQHNKATFIRVQSNETIQCSDTTLYTLELNHGDSYCAEGFLIRTV